MKSKDSFFFHPPLYFWRRRWSRFRRPQTPASCPPPDNWCHLGGCYLGDKPHRHASSQRTRQHRESSNSKIHQCFSKGLLILFPANKMPTIISLNIYQTFFFLSGSVTRTRPVAHQLSNSATYKYTRRQWKILTDGNDPQSIHLETTGNMRIVRSHDQEMLMRRSWRSVK